MYVKVPLGSEVNWPLKWIKVTRSMSAIYITIYENSHDTRIKQFTYSRSKQTCKFIAIKLNSKRLNKSQCRSTTPILIEIGRVLRALLRGGGGIITKVTGSCATFIFEISLKTDPLLLLVTEPMTAVHPLFVCKQLDPWPPETDSCPFRNVQYNEKLICTQE
jgi:hypothetical protein